MEDERTPFPPLAGSDAERRAALDVAARLRAGGRVVSVETEWVRPRSELAHALHAGLGVAASVVAVGAPVVGLGLALLALVSLLLDLSGRLFLLRRLTPERATQSVIALGSSAGEPRLRVVLVAGCDVGRGGLAARSAAARAYLWVALSLAVVVACAAARWASDDVGTVVGIVQLLPTLVLLAAFGLFIDGATAKPSAFEPAAVETVVAAAEAVDAAPLSNVAVDVVIAGAQSGQAVGFLKLLRRHRLPRERTAVIELAPAATAGWQTSDGPLLPLRYHPQLVALAAAAASEEPTLGARARSGHATGAALRARQRRLPALRLGARDQPSLLALLLALIETLDTDLANERAGGGTSEGQGRSRASRRSAAGRPRAQPSG